MDYDFSALEQKSRSLMQRFGFLEVAMRQNDLACEVRNYLKTHSTAAVVNLGCGLNDPSWFEKIDAPGGAVFFAAGVSYYFLKEQVRTLVQA